MICFQNIKDPFAPYEQVKGFITKIDSEIMVKEMPRNDHHYPYYQEFEEFLKNNQQGKDS